MPRTTCLSHCIEYRLLGTVFQGGNPSSLGILNSAINGQRFSSDDDKECSTCGDLNAEKKCSACKMVLTQANSQFSDVQNHTFVFFRFSHKEANFSVRFATQKVAEISVRVRIFYYTKRCRCAVQKVASSCRKYFEDTQDGQVSNVCQLYFVGGLFISWSVCRFTTATSAVRKHIGLCTRSSARR